MHNFDLFGEPVDSTASLPPAAPAPMMAATPVENQPEAATTPTLNAPAQPTPDGAALTPSPPGVTIGAHANEEEDAPPAETTAGGELDCEPEGEVADDDSAPSYDSSFEEGTSDTGTQRKARRASRSRDGAALLNRGDVVIEAIHPNLIIAFSGPESREKPIPESSQAAGFQEADLMPDVLPILALSRPMLVERQERKSGIRYVALCNAGLLPYYRSRGILVPVGIIENPALIGLLKRPEIRELMRIPSGRLNNDERRDIVEKLQSEAVCQALFLEGKKPSQRVIGWILGVSTRTVGGDSARSDNDSSTPTP